MHLMTQERYENICKIYWVCAWKDNLYKTDVYSWVCSQIEPYPVINPSKYWRKPTFEECMERQKAYNNNPLEFIKEAKKRSESLHWYAERANFE